VKPLLVFDMDGVLAEVTESYRETITQTVRHFTGATVENSSIQAYKDRGGWNNDWALSHRLCQDLGVEVPYADVIARFNAIFLGPNYDGLILREQWMPAPGLLERLAARFSLAIFTGRPLDDLSHTLRRFASGIAFSPVITMESVTRQKPDPQGLHLIMEQCPGAALTYVGDTVDDARAAAAASVPFIGVSPKPATAARLREEGALAVIADINAIEGVLPA
jgi:HAD superfamily hydrolase (TIGR01548 family)